MKMDLQQQFWGRSIYQWILIVLGGISGFIIGYCIIPTTEYGIIGIIGLILFAWVNVEATKESLIQKGWKKPNGK